MSEDWAAIASEIDAAIASVGFAVTLEEPTFVDPTASDPVAGVAQVHDAIALDDRITRRDAGGIVTGSVRVLTIAAIGAVPQKGWFAIVRCMRHRIATVSPIAPGGVDLLYDLELEA